MRFDPRLAVAEIEFELDAVDQEIGRPVIGEAGRLRRLVERCVEHDNGTIGGVIEGKRGGGRVIAAIQGGIGEALYLLPERRYRALPNTAATSRVSWILVKIGCRSVPGDIAGCRALQ